MSENQTTKKHLPTGEEPPKGYETLAVEQTEGDGSRVDFVMYSHLARSERAEIEALRTKALTAVQRYIGLSNEPLTIEREVNIIEAVDDSNKMFALAFQDKKLVGYSLVVVGWPEACKWLIQHMIIDPEQRNQGIGTTIVKSIERYAQESEVSADSIFAVPIQESGKEFWQNNGYTVEAARFLITEADVDHEIIVYHKAL
ncbi:MAG: GNAT family N-acetyltransferase [Coriobacteriales bacterium]|jgi:GNAT superfamily N-acetyltransferase|nr:GNAT family N-acetyltransferase [Coriobacteriales bacterium]